MEGTFYLTISQIQEVLDEHFEKTGECLSLPEAMEYLINHNRYNFTADNHLKMRFMHHLDQMDFLKKIQDISIEVTRKHIQDLRDDISWFPKDQVDVFVQNSFHNIQVVPHTHINFEVVYVYSGEYDFLFQEEMRILKEGDVVIISRGALHCLKERTPDSFYMSFFINYDTLSVSFLSVLSGHDILSDYLKKMLTNKKLPNYLLISTHHHKGQYTLAQDLFLEQHRYDEYSPQCSLCWLKLFFANVLRSYKSFHQYAAPGVNVNFAPILDYIDKNYRTASLGDIARHFNYSESYLSMIIQRVTGKKYSDIVNNRKLEEARDYLERTDISIKEIASLCGYNDADHFSKTFRKEYGMSPREYRRQIKK